jgi:hypothetical protein
MSAIEMNMTKAKKTNKGTGAGGVNTNVYGKKFEETTNNYQRLIDEGYEDHEGYLEKVFEDKKIIYLTQGGMKKYKLLKQHKLFRNPDEAYIIKYNDGRKVIKILEKKEQNKEGSVETKLWAGHSLKREYEIMLGDTWEVNYAFCVNDFLKKKLVSKKDKYITLNIILNESNIPVMFGDDDDYYYKLDEWINS